MITDMNIHWARLTSMMESLCAQASSTFRGSWEMSAPSTSEVVEHFESAVLDVRDTANSLIHELIYLRGYLDAQERRHSPEEEPNENGDVIIHITPKTAPCSEIAKSLGVSTAKVVGAARRLGLQPAGRVEWQLSNGQFASAAAYSLLQWKQIRDGLECRSRINATAPARLLDDESDE
jgi:hypothetical protein